jgi:hypothetical protein
MRRGVITPAGSLMKSRAFATEDAMISARFAERANVSAALALATSTNASTGSGRFASSPVR